MLINEFSINLLAVCEQLASHLASHLPSCQKCLTAHAYFACFSSKCEPGFSHSFSSFKFNSFLMKSLFKRFAITFNWDLARSGFSSVC